MRNARIILLLTPIVVAACSASPDKRTLAQLRRVQPDVEDVQVEDGLDKAMESYRRYLEQTPKTAMTPEAMRRLADLKVEKEFGILGDGKLVELEAPAEVAPEHIARTQQTNNASKAVGIADHSESQKDFERRATAESAALSIVERGTVTTPAGTQNVTASGPLEAIALYDELLAEYPHYEHNDEVLYQKSRAYDELGRTEDGMQTMERLIAEYPHSRYIDEVQFRRGEYFFTRRKYRDAEGAYGAIVAFGAHSEYYELALYKLGWTLYKQEFYDEALDRYIALLDHKVTTGYDFDAAHEEADERRIADTFRVISLSFSNLGGPEIANEYFTTKGKRSYEDRIYSNLGEFYLTKLRYHDAAGAYKAFMGRYPYHRSSPHFGMRVVEIYTKGGFQKLVLDAKSEFANSYGLQSEYWRHFSAEESPEVLSYLKSNLKDLANHYHSQYQRADRAEEQPLNYREALQWYQQYLTSFPNDAESPAINYQLADLLFEEKNFGDAAKQYERTAYDYPTHEKAAAAGYAAVYAYREQLKAAQEGQQDGIKRTTVASSLKFADKFPSHEQAPVVLGAAADDLYEMKDYRPAIDAAQTLIERYPAAALPIRRSAWLVVAHSSFELGEFPHAETGYAQVLELTPASDEKRQSLVENLAAAIYKQGELANTAQDYRGAANHFLRVKQLAPGAEKICASAEYDAAAALIRLQDWAAAADVLESFRRSYPQHPMQGDATQQLAVVYRQSGQVARAAGEYERIASESDQPQTRGEALLVAGDLYVQGKNSQRALAVYGRYVEEFPQPFELAVDTRSKMADIQKANRDEVAYRKQLEQIVAIDAAAGSERTARTRFVASHAALVLAEQLYEQFTTVKLTQPFQRSLQEKQKRMDAAMKAFGSLVDYQVGDVTAAATYYTGEVYYGFNRALMDSERPANLKTADLQQYDLELEETAYPFEEKAIVVHEKNLELIRSGIYNPWIEKSLAKLALLMPARYAKGEISSGFLGSIDRYAYRAPAAPAIDLAATGKDGKTSSPSATATGEVGHATAH
ncbi:MAG: tetratricopeptide repeat protein [Steroidobacteraceae bacterium]